MSALAEKYLNNNNLEQIVNFMTEYKKLEENHGLLAVHSQEAYITPDSFFELFESKIRRNDYQLTSMRDADFSFRLVIEHKGIRFKTLLKKNQWQEYLIESEVLD